MTDKEAIKWMETFQDNVVRCCDDTHKKGLALNATINAINALKKQIPKKVKIDGGFVNYVCPRCEDVEFGCYEPNYCENCGQAIDWSEDE